LNLVYQTVDRTALPAGLLADCKQHLRVDHCDDDYYIRNVIARAIDHCENRFGIQINPATVLWTPRSTQFCDGRALSQVMPINTLAAAADAGDVSASYSFESRALGGAPAYYILGAWQAGLMLTIVSGFAVATLPFGLLDRIFAMSAHLYEHREIFVNSGTDVVPQWDMDTFAMWWVPRV
jgi:hypothetical protein